MSDAAAKAKARRAKILARENKQVSAVNVDVIQELISYFLTSTLNNYMECNNQLMSIPSIRMILN